MKKWEYTEALVLTPDMTLAVLKDFGQTGWEFTGHVRVGVSGDYFLMKREVDEIAQMMQPVRISGYVPDHQLTSDERVDYGERAEEFPPNQIVYSLSSVESLFRKRLNAVRRGQRPHIANRDSGGGFSCSCGHSDPEKCPYEGR